MTFDLNNNLDTLALDPADGDQYIDELRDRLLDLLLPAQTIEDVEERLRNLYPESKLVDLAIREATNTLHRSSHKNHKQRHHSTGATFIGALHNITSFAVAKVSNRARESDLTKFKVVLVQYIIDEIIHLAVDFVKRQKSSFIITRSDIRTAMHADKDLMDMFLSDTRSPSIIENHPILAQIRSADKSSQSARQQRFTTYEQKVRSMVDSENSFIRGLKLIIKVFKAQLEELPHIRHEVQIIFCNIEDLLELSILLVNIFEDALESVVGQDDDVPYVGSEILDLAQAEEFHAYCQFAYKRLSRDENWYRAYLSIMSNENTMISIRTAGQSFDLAVRHLLPNYLLNTITQFFEYHRNLEELYELSRQHNNEQDTIALKETVSILIKTKKSIEDLLDAEMNRIEIEPMDSKQAESIRAILERKLDAELQHERNSPLPYMPPPEMYRFSEPDTDENIQFEGRSVKDLERRSETEQIPVIRCATLTKLVERLTYHKYHPNIVESFLTTYRSFIPEPEELLDLLIERFKIPDPPLSIVQPNACGEYDITAYKQYLKLFRERYSKPVKMRVINVLKSWIKNHYYDFERNHQLSEKLNSFLDEIYNNEKVLRRQVVSIKNNIEQKKICQRDNFKFMLAREPPPILWWTTRADEFDKFDLLTLHPVEFARQLTIVEFDLFRAIKPSELINVRDLGMRSRKDRDKYESSPNLSRLTRHFTLLSYWIRKCIIETDDFDKRSAIYNRTIEIMAVLRELNNHTGLLSIGSAIESAPISRLLHTKKTLTSTTSKVLDDYRELTSDHQKGLQQELKKCDPPCIPYLGSYQTKLIHAKEGNRTFLDEVDSSKFSPTLSNDEFSPATPIIMQNQFFGGPSAGQPPPKMINFYKQRIRASLVAEISNYQNPPYCLNVQPDIRRYIESIETQMVDFALSLDPQAQNSDYWAEPSVPQMTKRLDDYLFEKSEKIEPKNCTKPPSRPKSKLPDYYKSPGIRTN